MTAFIAEGKRLGIDHPTTPLDIMSDRVGNPFVGVALDREGLCVTDCKSCRLFRSRVREALAVEAAEKQRPLDEAFQSGFEQGRLQGRIESLDDIMEDLGQQYEDDIAALSEIRQAYVSMLNA